MGIEKSLSFYLYSKCPKCSEHSWVDLDCTSATVARSIINCGSFCFATTCSRCSGSFITTIGDPKSGGCEECEIREHCLQSGSSPLLWVNGAKRKIFE